MVTMRAKVVLESVVSTVYNDTIKCSAVTNGTLEDNTFSNYTPSFSFEMTITNPDLMGKLKPGMRFYVDFTEAKE